MLVQVTCDETGKRECYIGAVNILEDGTREVLPIAMMICADLKPLHLPGKLSGMSPAWKLLRCVPILRNEL